MRLCIPEAWIALRTVILVILEAVQVLVSLAARFTFVWFVFFHALSAWVRIQRIWINDGESTVRVGMQRLSIVAMLNTLISTLRLSSNDAGNFDLHSCGTLGRFDSCKPSHIQSQDNGTASVCHRHLDQVHLPTFVALG